MKKIILSFCTLALAIATAGTNYRVTLFQPSIINGTELKAGEYKLELKDNNKAVVRSGKNVVEADVRVENTQQRFSTNSVRYSNVDGRMKVQEMHLGGTNLKVVFAN